jgi:hypothetical protein
VPQKPGFSNIWIAGLYGLVALAAVAAWRTHQGAAVPSVMADTDVRGDRREPLASDDAGDKPTSTAASAKTPPRDSGRSIDDIVADASRIIQEQGLGGEHLLLESQPSSDPAVLQRQQKIKLGAGASLGGLRPFPEDNPWNQRVDNAPVDPHSQSILSTIGFERGLHADFGSGEWNGAKIGIPYIVVSGAQPAAPVEFVDYPEESDAGPYPIPPGAPIEGFPNTDGDRHVVVLDRDHWKLYELFAAVETPNGWQAANGAIWDLTTNAQRPIGWTSADAAGLPIFPGLVRYDEVDSGEIRHALRFTLAETRKAFVPPATHWASRNGSPLLPPMGMRVRLKKDFDTSKFPRHVQVILRCLQQYGMILADNGSNWFISGSPDSRWDDDALHTIKQVNGSDFEVLRMDGLVTE